MKLIHPDFRYKIGHYEAEKDVLVIQYQAVGIGAAMAMHELLKNAFDDFNVVIYDNKTGELL